MEKASFLPTLAKYKYTRYIVNQACGFPRQILNMNDLCTLIVCICENRRQWFWAEISSMQKVSRCNKHTSWMLTVAAAAAIAAAAQQAIKQTQRVVVGVYLIIELVLCIRVALVPFRWQILRLTCTNLSTGSFDSMDSILCVWWCFVMSPHCEKLNNKSVF